MRTKMRVGGNSVNYHGYSRVELKIAVILHDRFCPSCDPGPCSWNTETGVDTPLWDQPCHKYWLDKSNDFIKKDKIVSRHWERSIVSTSMRDWERSLDFVDATADIFNSLP